MRQGLLTLAGAAAGGVLGYFAFFWMVQQGYYGLVLPGGLLGLGAGVARNRSIWPAVVCAVLATALGLFTEWQYRPFVADDSLAFFLAHVQDLQPVTLAMVGLGGLVGFWVPFRRIDRAS